MLLVTTVWDPKPGMALKKLHFPVAFQCTVGCNTALLERVQEPMRPRLGEYKMAQSLFISVKTKKFTAVKDVFENLKASISQKLSNAARVHQWVPQHYKIRTRVLRDEVLKHRSSPVPTRDQWLLRGCGRYQGHSKVMRNVILSLMQKTFLCFSIIRLLFPSSSCWHPVSSTSKVT